MSVVCRSTFSSKLENEEEEREVMIMLCCCCCVLSMIKMDVNLSFYVKLFANAILFAPASSTLQYVLIKDETDRAKSKQLLDVK